MILEKTIERSNLLLQYRKNKNFDKTKFGILVASIFFFENIEI